MSESVSTPQVKILRINQVAAITGYSRPSIYRLMREGQFPRSVQLGPKSVGWRSDDVDAWISSRQYTGEGK
jgi:prophage regulatory protein